jgi:hypothetical protein
LRLRLGARRCDVAALSCTAPSHGPRIGHPASIAWRKKGVDNVNIPLEAENFGRDRQLCCSMLYLGGERHDVRTA